MTTTLADQPTTQVRSREEILAELGELIAPVVAQSTVTPGHEVHFNWDAWQQRRDDHEAAVQIDYEDGWVVQGRKARWSPRREH